MKTSHKKRIRLFSRQVWRNYKKSIRALGSGLHPVDSEIVRLKNNAVAVTLELASRNELKRRYPKSAIDVKSAFSRAFQRSMPAYYFYRTGALSKEEFVSRCLAQLDKEIVSLKEENNIVVHESPANLTMQFLRLMDASENGLRKLHKNQ